MDYNFSDLLDDAQGVVEQVGGIAVTGQEYYNQFTGQTRPAPGPILPGSGTVAAQPAATTMPVWIWGLILGVLAILAFMIFGGRRGK